MAGSCNLQEESFSLKEAERNYSYIHMNRFSGKMFFDYFSAENMAINDSRAVFDTLSGGVIVQRCEDDYVLLYADANCTTRAVSLYPRQLWIEKTVETYSYGSYQGISSQLFEVTIPVGTDSLFLGSYHNVENYASSNPYNISITQYNIVNSHVPSYTHPIL